MELKDRRCKYAWPTEVGQTVSMTTRAQPMSFRVLAWNYGNRRGWRISCHKALPRVGDGPNDNRFDVTRVS